ncbi:MAG: hypothetical protein AAF479_03580, partial [Pseudomonadota bacterium]
WTKLMDVPELTDDFVEMVGDQCDEQAGKLGPRELETIRDDNLIAIMQALKVNDWGAGKTLAAYEKSLFDQGAAKPAEDLSEPIRTVERLVPPGARTNRSGPGIRCCPAIATTHGTVVLGFTAISRRQCRTRAATMICSS